jgi:hypothetical protein
VGDGHLVEVHLALQKLDYPARVKNHLPRGVSGATIAILCRPDRDFANSGKGVKTMRRREMIAVLLFGSGALAAPAWAQSDKSKGQGMDWNEPFERLPEQSQGQGQGRGGFGRKTDPEEPGLRKGADKTDQPPKKGQAKAKGRTNSKKPVN